MQKNRTVIVEGNVGCGKTSFLNLFKTWEPEIVECFPEPVSKWTNVSNHNLLENAHLDPKRCGFTFQTYVMYTMADIHLRRQTFPVKMMERSLFSANHCFVQYLRNGSFLSDVEFEILQEGFNMLTSNLRIQTDLIVYIRTPPEKCFERIQKRGRSEEKGITLRFLEDIHELYENWLIHKTPVPPPAPVLIHDGSLESQGDLQREYERNKLLILTGDEQIPLNPRRTFFSNPFHLNPFFS